MTVVPSARAALEIGEVEPVAEIGREPELAGDADDVERMGARFGRALEPGGEAVFALLSPPVGEDGLERGRPAGVAGALADVGNGGEEGRRKEGRGGGGGRGWGAGCERKGEPARRRARSAGGRALEMNGTGR